LTRAQKVFQGASQRIEVTTCRDAVSMAGNARHVIPNEPRPHWIELFHLVTPSAGFRGVGQDLVDTHAGFAGTPRALSQVFNSPPSRE
jgi:hypothetical protein